VENTETKQKNQKNQSPIPTRNPRKGECPLGQIIVTALSTEAILERGDPPPIPRKVGGADSQLKGKMIFEKTIASKNNNSLI